MAHVDVEPLLDVITDPVGRLCRLYVRWRETGQITALGAYMVWPNGGWPAVERHPYVSALSVLLCGHQLGYLDLTFGCSEGGCASFLRFFARMTGFDLQDPFMIPGFAEPRPWPFETYVRCSTFTTTMQAASSHAGSRVIAVGPSYFAVQFGCLIRHSY